MSRRRKRKKENSLEDKGTNEKQSSPPLESASQRTSSPDKKSAKATESQPIPSKPIADKIDLEKELEVELGDDFGGDEMNSREKKSLLPSNETKRDARILRRPESAPETSSQPIPSSESKSSSPPQKHRIPRSAESASESALRKDGLEDLEDPIPSNSPTPKPSPAKPKPPSRPVESQPAKALAAGALAAGAVPSDANDQKNEATSLTGSDISSESVPETSPEPTPPSSPAAETEPEKRSLPALLRARLGALSLFEQVSLGALALILVVAAFWSSSVVSARIPNTVIASKLKYPLKGDSVVLGSYESYWRSPIREGANIDEGVPESIEIIPEVKITLDPQSKAKSLRFLFRDEEGRYVGDSSTVNISGTKFLPSNNVTAVTTGNTATIHSTTGFEHEGELISYLADETFQWEVVILESKDGVKYTEFIAIPISANRNDNL